MKQPLILTHEQRLSCAHALLQREMTMTPIDERALECYGGRPRKPVVVAWAIGLVRRAETYLAIVHFRAVCAGSVALLLAVQGHGLLLDFIKAAGWSRTAAQILADVAFGPELNPEPAPASE